MSAADRPITFGVIVGTRGFFNPVLAADGRSKLLARLSKLGFAAIVPSENVTRAGVVETRDDARIVADLFKENREKIDGIVVSLPNFGDETGIVQALDMAKLDVPVLVHAFDDDLDKVDVAHRRDAFCGKISVCSNLSQYGIRWTDTTEHTCPVDGPELAADLERFARLCRVVRGMRGARVGAIGSRPAAFQTVRYSEKLLQAAGVTVVPVDLSEILAAAERIQETVKEVQEKLTAIRDYGRIPERIPASSVVKQARLSVAIDRWMAENQCVASAIQCWESVQMNYGCAACLSMSLMGEQRRMPSACEVDVNGAVSMYALSLATGNASALLDWNNNYGADRRKCVATHCSNFPKSFTGAEIEISELDILGESLGRERCFGAVKGKVAPGPMTFFRLDTDDARGAIRGYVGEGEFTADPFPMDGGIAVCRVDGLRSLLGYVTRNGFAHHVAMVRSHCASIVHEASTRYLGWDVHLHGVGTAA
ncbi:MAG: fucose isomerase [Spirochaetia bacterium]|jgi:L-fucose isomerase-like protein